MEHAGERSEYVALTVRQLKAGLLELAPRCRDGGTVFPVGKNDGNQRLVWHGTRVSRAAARPPPPRHLASPTVFGFLDLEAGARLRVSKRDCRTWFDQLALEPSLRPYFGRPRVGRDELLAAGLTLSELCDLGGDAHTAWFVPCATVWPMGFSWSSCVAQETLPTIAEQAGLDSSRILACDTSLPVDLDLAFAVATDDLMVFSSRGPGHTTSAVAAFEESLIDNRAEKNPAKDVDDVLSETCVGVDLVDGTHWRAPVGRLWSLFDAVLDLSRGCRCSPGSVAAYLGVAQWYDLLRRLRLSVFEHVYDFASGIKAKDWSVTDILPRVLEELLLDAVLSAFGAVDMQRPFLPFLGATDASTDYGHGATVAPMSGSDLRRVSRLSCKAGGLLLAKGPLLDERLMRRLGPRHDLGLQLGDFEVVLCVQVPDPRHINLGEAASLLCFVRWVLRTRRRLNRRRSCRSTARSCSALSRRGDRRRSPLNRYLRRLAALCFAGGIVLHCVFVPRARMPADWPSRGGPATWPRELRRSTRHGAVGGPQSARRARRQPRPSRMERLVAREAEEDLFMREHCAWALSSTDGDSSDAWEPDPWHHTVPSDVEDYPARPSSPASS